jgi:hypothetical protein
MQVVIPFPCLPDLSCWLKYLLLRSTIKEMCDDDDDDDDDDV